MVILCGPGEKPSQRNIVASQEFEDCMISEIVGKCDDESKRQLLLYRHTKSHAHEDHKGNESQRQTSQIPKVRELHTAFKLYAVNHLQFRI